MEMVPHPFEDDTEKCLQKVKESQKHASVLKKFHQKILPCISAADYMVTAVPGSNPAFPKGRGAVQYCIIRIQQRKKPITELTFIVLICL